MGYFTTLTEADFSIPETPEVLAALHEMDTKFHDLKRGGRIGGDQPEEKWFSWMPKLDTLPTVRAIFEQLGFVTDDTVDDGVDLIGYDSKTGQEGLFLAVVAPFVKDGSYTNWRGEDGMLYRYEVVKGRLVEKYADLVWTDARPYRETVFHTERGTDGVSRTHGVHVDPYTVTV